MIRRHADALAELYAEGMLLQPLSNYLKMFRKRSGLSQGELALLLGCKSGSKVSRYERGGRVPTFDTLAGLEVVFKKPIRELFRGRYERVHRDVRLRAQRLSRKVDSRALTPGNKRKLDSLTEVIHPTT